MQAPRRGLLIAAAIGLAFGLAAAAPGQSRQTLPPANDTVAGGTGNSLPIGNFPAGTIQVFYGEDLLTGIPVGSVITGMQVRLDRQFSSAFPASAFTISRYDVTLASSSLTPATMSTNYATNLLAPVLVRSGPLNVPANAYPFVSTAPGVPQAWGPLIPFTTAYRYSGGPLVIQWRVTSPSSTFTSFADANNTGTSQSTAISDGNADATASLVVDPGGPIVRLTFTPPTPDLASGVTKLVVPDQLADARGDAGYATLTSSISVDQVAVASESEFDTIGPGSGLVAMAFRRSPNQGTSWPDVVTTFAQFDVELSRATTAPGSLLPTIASNVGADAVQVRGGSLTFPIGAMPARGDLAYAPFGRPIAFSNPYFYRGGPLLAVTRHSGQPAAGNSFLDGVFSPSSGYNTTVQAREAAPPAGGSAPNSSPYITTMFSIDAGTSSPLNQLSPGADAFGTLLEAAPVLQTILSASELRYIPVGSVIDSLWLRQIASALTPAPALDVTATSFEVSVSSATAQPAGMGLTFAANEGADKMVVHSGPWSLAAGTMPPGSNGNFGKLVQFQRAFVYKGGPLCITIRHTGLSGPVGRMEAVFGTAETNRTTYAFSVGAPAGFFYSSNYTGTAMKLGYIPSVMTPNSIATREGSSGWDLPFTAQAAVQTIIPASELRSVPVGSVITGLSLRADTFFSNKPFPDADTFLQQFDVSIAPAARGPLTISTTFADNVAPGELMTRRGPLTVPANAFPISGPPAAPADNAWYIPFTRLYRYTGGDLCVTIRSQGALNTDFSASFDGESDVPIAAGASVYNYGSSSATSGLTWGPLGMRLSFTPRAFCPGDLNNDGQVDTTDFVLFVAAYNLLDCTDPSMPPGCPSDLNYDTIVDNQDFVLFVKAYNEFLCP